MEECLRLLLSVCPSAWDHSSGSKCTRVCVVVCDSLCAFPVCVHGYTFTWLLEGCLTSRSQFKQWGASISVHSFRLLSKPSIEAERKIPQQWALLSDFFVPVLKLIPAFSSFHSFFLPLMSLLCHSLFQFYPGFSVEIKLGICGLVRFSFLLCYWQSVCCCLRKWNLLGCKVILRQV